MLLGTPDVAVQPAHLWVPEHAVSSAGEEACDFAASVGLEPDPEQQLCLNALLAERADGRWAALEAALIASRQNLKTWIFRVIALLAVYVFEERLVVWTAHEFNTTMEAFRDIREVIDADGNGHLRKRVRKVIETNGKEGIEFTNGQRLRFRARTKSGGRGLTGDRVFLDEAFALVAAMMGSLIPTMSARSVHGNPHVLYGSSAGKLEAHVLRDIRDRGRAGGDPSLVYIEFADDPRTACASKRCDHRLGSEGCALDNEQAVRRSNPALGRRISLEFIRAERRALATDPMEFARERLGWWEDPEQATTALPMDAWRDCRDPASELNVVDVFAYAVALDSSWSTIAVSGRRDDGVEHVEVVDYRQGTDWLADRLAGLCEKHGVARVAALEKGPESSLEDEINEALDAPVEKVPQSQFAEACGALMKSVLRRSVRHLGQPELDVCARKAVRRPVGDEWVWSRRLSPIEISPIVAITVASWAPKQAGDGPSVYEERGMAVL